MTQSEILGTITPDRWAKILDTGYNQFHSKTFKMRGLCKFTNDHLEILAIDSIAPNSGNCRRFLAACCKAWPKVSIWEVWNKNLESALIRYGFTECVDRKTNAVGYSHSAKSGPAKTGCCS